jgi:hypothetical protein
VIGHNMKNKPKTTTKKELKRNKKIEMNFIWEGLLDPVREKVGKCLTAKEVWHKLHNLYSTEYQSTTEP